MPRATKDDTTHPYDQLPFVSYRKGEGRIFWNPKPTGDYDRDNALGVEYADAVIPLLRDNDYLFCLILCGILKYGDNENHRVILISFATQLSKRLITGQASQLRAIRACAAPL